MKKPLFVQFLIFLIFPFVLTAQVQFTASVDTKQVPIGEVFEIKFTLENAKGTNFRPPVFGEFNVASGPNKMNTATIVNGSSQSSESFIYVLQAKQEGVFTIGSATIDVKGTTLRTTPLSISVQKGKRQTPNDVKGGKEEAFIRAEVSSNKAYIGQQIILDYKLYTRANINGVTRVNESKYDGFFKLEVNDFPHHDNRVTLGGKVYVTRILQRIALFPQREGIFKFEPFSLQMGIVKANRRDDEDPFAALFSSPQVENRVVSANEVNIEIKALPTPVPASFTGAVGDFKTDFFISKTDGTTDDVISLKMNITGNGDAKRWQAPKMKAIEGLEIYEAKVLKEENFERDGEWQTLKEIEYLIVPKQAGNYSIKPEFSFLNTESEEGYKTDVKNFDLKIGQGSNKAATILHDRVKDILGIKTTTTFVNQVTRFWGSTLFFLLLAVPFLLLVSVMAYKKWQIRQSKRDINLLRQANAPKVAEGRLAVALEFLKKGNERLFYNEVSKTLFNYVSDKFGIPLAEFTKNNVQEKLMSVNINELHVKNFVQILNDCEIALFAGRHTEGAAEGIYDRAAGVIVDIEQDLK